MDPGRDPRAMEELPKQQQAGRGRLAERDQRNGTRCRTLIFVHGGTGMALLEEMKADGLAGTFSPFEEGGRNGADTTLPLTAFNPPRRPGATLAVLAVLIASGPARAHGNRGWQTREERDAREGNRQVSFPCGCRNPCGNASMMTRSRDRSARARSARA